MIQKYLLPYDQTTERLLSSGSETPQFISNMPFSKINIAGLKGLKHCLLLLFVWVTISTRYLYFDSSICWLLPVHISCRFIADNSGITLCRNNVNILPSVHMDISHYYVHSNFYCTLWELYLSLTANWLTLITTWLDFGPFDVIVAVITT